MRIGLVFLVLAYVLSQFFRSFLAVLAPVLNRDIGAGAEDLAFASGVWFFTFAAMQIPVGAALDSVGPRRTVANLFAMCGGGGALMFALAQTPVHLTLAMMLIGAGCSPVLMSAYYIFARTFAAAQFATLAATIIGIGALGNLAGSAPLAWAIGTFGWRATMGGLGAMTFAVALALGLTLKDPPRIGTMRTGSVIDVLRIPALWPIFAMMFVCYAPAAGLRGLWAGPYAAEVFGADAGQIGQMTLVMGLAMVAGNFAYGPLDRWLGTRKWVIFWGNLGVALTCLALWRTPDAGFVTATLLFAVIGFCGSSFGIVIAHGRAFVPVHLTGRGVTMLNLFGIMGAAIAQVVTGQIHGTVEGGASQQFAAIFLYFGLTTVVGLCLYLLSRDRTD
ncbi:MAG: MFS transporter [Rhodobacterales bacterium]|nr:MFS transporter [Rhodobacterales bacterium]